MILSFCRLLLALATLPGVALAAPAYIAVPLGTLGGVTAYGTGINANGQISGFADTDATGALHRHAFLHTGTTIRNLGALNNGSQSFGYAINDAVQVVGSSNTASSGQLRGVVFSGNPQIDLIDLSTALGPGVSNAYAINNAGNVAGAFTTAGATHAYRIRGGTMNDLGTLGGASSQAYAINLFDDVTGFAHVPSQDAHAFRFDSNGMLDLGTLGGRSSIGRGINAAGHVVGESFTAGDAANHAFFSAGSGMLDLGTLGGITSRALAINSGDTVVGESTNAAGALHAFAIVGGAMVDLNTVTTGLNGAVLTTATAVNDAGQIVAMSCTGTLVCPQAFRLDPVGASKVQAVEYYHRGFDHYFLTAMPDEIAKLDNGTIAGWVRTGTVFNVYVGDQVGTTPVCRFFSTSFAPKSSHFYTPFAGECVTLQRAADWQFEARVFNIALPDGNGNCPAVTQPVYRLYNNGMGNAPNHRFTPSLMVRAQMIAQGWIPEGLGSDAVGMCAPL